MPVAHPNAEVLTIRSAGTAILVDSFRRALPISIDCSSRLRVGRAGEQKLFNPTSNLVSRQL
ncbi:hypothetical protein M413DRAFT_448647 [Hebeloma cylindrosporum]|uniref:Uncharacterized protein n=1 Tax=Hebeloma cylindrosporum TaxID=76867 RepID=A0A0C3C0E4_HEBCY|nr:hypothetical protein M413DRAFT_448647 [Hebeloma cylindrosporum h7]